jgi:chromosome segregation ATPase
VARIAEIERRLGAPRRHWDQAGVERLPPREVRREFEDMAALEIQRRSANDTTDFCTTEREHLREEREITRQEIDRQLEEMQNGLTRILAIEEEIRNVMRESYERIIAELRAQISILTAELAALRQENSRNETRITEVETRLRALQERLSAAEREIAGLRNRVASMEMDDGGGSSCAIM